MASTFTVEQPKIVGHVLSVPLPTLTGKEGTTQTFTASDIVVMSSGVLVVGGDTPNADTIVGMPTSAASGTTGAAIQFCPFLPGTIIEANLSHTAGAYVMIAGDMFAQFGLGYTSSKFYIDEDVRSGDAVNWEKLFATVIGFAEGKVTSTGLRKLSAVGDTDARVRAVVIGSVFTAELGVIAS